MQGQEETHASVLTHRPDGGGARSIAVNPRFQVPVVVEGHLGVIGNSQKTQVDGKAPGKNCTEEHRRTKMTKKRRTRGADRRQVRTFPRSLRVALMQERADLMAVEEGKGAIGVPDFQELWWKPRTQVL